MAEEKVCEICARAIPAASSRTKYCCDECARVARLNQFRRYNREADGKPAEDPPQWITPREYGEIMWRLGYIECAIIGLPDTIRECVNDYITDIAAIVKKYRG